MFINAFTTRYVSVRDFVCWVSNTEFLPIGNQVIESYQTKLWDEEIVIKSSQHGFVKQF